jgi:hypothetical protein
MNLRNGKTHLCAARAMQVNSQPCKTDAIPHQQPETTPVKEVSAHFIDCINALKLVLRLGSSEHAQNGQGAPRKQKSQPTEHCK